MITVQDLRLAKPIVLERLTGIPAPQFFRWSMTRIPSQKSINRVAKALEVEPEIVVQAFELRKADYQAAQIAYQKFEVLLEKSAA